jgi:ribosomal protein S18 acetylase RimI-like enzyme
MIVQTKNGKEISIRKLSADDFDLLTDYLCHLSAETLKRFGPHKFNKQTILDLFENSGNHLGYIAQDTKTPEIIAYSIVKGGYLEHDCIRLQTYGLILSHETDCTFAPSVADQWQSLGIGNIVFNFILSDLNDIGIKRIILWGGVQCDNFKAVNYYLKNGFRTVGQFDYYGPNYDMIYEFQKSQFPSSKF